jgi:hypothetical protein
VTPLPPATPPQQSEPQAASTSPNWRRFRSSFDRAVTSGDLEAQSEARQQMHQMHVALELKDQELEGLKTALESKKRRSKKKKVLPLSPQDPNVQGGAIFWDPASVARAKERMKDMEKQAIADDAAKADRKQVQHNNKILKEKDKVKRQEKAALRRKKAAQKRAEKAQGIAERAAERERVKTLKNTEKVSQLPKQAKPKASAKAQSKSMKHGSSAVGGSSQVAYKPSSAPPGFRTRGGRVTKPTKNLIKPKVSQ